MNAIFYIKLEHFRVDWVLFFGVFFHTVQKILMLVWIHIKLGKLFHAIQIILLIIYWLSLLDFVIVPRLSTIHCCRTSAWGKSSNIVLGLSPRKCLIWSHSYYNLLKFLGKTKMRSCKDLSELPESEIVK